jgi:hypothetical protein
MTYAPIFVARQLLQYGPEDGIPPFLFIRWSIRMKPQHKKPFVAPTLKHEASLTEITLSGDICVTNPGLCQ